MPGFGDIVQKAFYLGVGAASFAAEKAGATIQELRTQGQKLADEMVQRGEMTAEEARKFVDDLVQQAQQPTVEQAPQNPENREPRRIEIIDDDEPQENGNVNDVDNLRKQVESLQQELRRLKND